jgi:AraC family transcriptional regulator
MTPSVQLAPRQRGSSLAVDHAPVLAGLALVAPSAPEDQARIVRLERRAGEFATAPTPDLQLVLVRGRPVRTSGTWGSEPFSATLSPGQFVALAPGRPSRVRFHDDHELLVLTIDADLAADLCPGLTDEHLEPLASARQADPLVQALVESLWRDDALMDGRVRESRIASVLFELLRLSGSARAPAPAAGGLAPWALKRVTDFMDASLTRSPSLPDLARLVRLSPFHFCRAFKASTGEPPHRWLQRRRLEKAKLLLQDSDLSILDVGAAVGYEDPSHFSKLFRREAGLTPRAYRRGTAAGGRSRVETARAEAQSPSGAYRTA